MMIRWEGNDLAGNGASCHRLMASTLIHAAFLLAVCFAFFLCFFLSLFRSSPSAWFLPVRDTSGESLNWSQKSSNHKKEEEGKRRLTWIRRRDVRFSLHISPPWSAFNWTVTPVTSASHCVIKHLKMISFPGPKKTNKKTMKHHGNRWILFPDSYRSISREFQCGATAPLAATIPNFRKCLCR